MQEECFPNQKIRRTRTPNTIRQVIFPVTIIPSEISFCPNKPLISNNKPPKSILKNPFRTILRPVRRRMTERENLFSSEDLIESSGSTLRSRSPSVTPTSSPRSKSASSSKRSFEVDLFDLPNSRNFKIDIPLYKWLKEEKSKDNSVTTRDIKLKARQMNILVNGEPNFAASNGWLNRWKKRVGVEEIDGEFYINEIKEHSPAPTSIFSDYSVENQTSSEGNVNITNEELMNLNLDKHKTILFVEPYFGGSHKQLIDTLVREFYEDCHLATLPAKKWHWRARCSALILSQVIPESSSYKVLFCSSVLNLAELLGLRPELQQLKKIVYFHENQLTYPKKEIKKRDFQFGYNEITTCLVADQVVFNSVYNLNTFLCKLESFIKIMPDNRPKDLVKIIKPKTKVIYFPIFLPVLPKMHKGFDVLHIIWPHRWEFDKGPDEFFDILFRMKAGKLKFILSVLGESYSEIPPVFDEAKEVLKDEIVHWGYLPNKEEYYDVLRRGHVVVSTAKHEFYGVAMLEAVHHGCFPLVPDRLVYPEIYDKISIYNNDKELFYKLRKYCYNPFLVKADYNLMKLDVTKYSTEGLLPDFKKLLLID